MVPPVFIEIVLLVAIIAAGVWMFRNHRIRHAFSPLRWRQEVDHRSWMTDDLSRRYLKPGLSFVDVVELLGSPLQSDDDEGHGHLSELVPRHAKLYVWPLWSDPPCDYIVLHFDQSDQFVERSYLLID